MTVAKVTKNIDWNLYFTYDESSPTCLRWKVDRKVGTKGVSPRAGLPAGNYSPGNNCGYAQVSLNGSTYMVHRVIWEMLRDKIVGRLCIDHINGDKLDNRIENLRVVTVAVNARNRKKSKANTSGVTGVTLVKTKYGNKWFAYYRDVTGKPRMKTFACKLYGHHEAFKKAVAFREEGLAEVNRLGAGYSERHGA